MTLSLEEYRAKLINNILMARSQAEVAQYIDSAIKALEKRNSSIIPPFVDKITDNIALFNPMNKDAQQWSNISLAKILFNRIRMRLNATQYNVQTQAT